MYDTMVMIRLKCPALGCTTTLELPDDTGREVMSATMVDHLRGHGSFGESMVSDLRATTIDGDRTFHGDLVRYIDRPLIGEGGGKRHAIRPGWIACDGHGPAICSNSYTVKIVIGFRGDELRATARKEPGTVQPDCHQCRRKLP